MTSYLNENDAIDDIKEIMRPHVPTASIRVFERNPIDEVGDDVIFGVMMQAGDSKILPVIKAIKNHHIETEKALRFDGSKLDMMAEKPTEYILIRATVIS